MNAIVEIDKAGRIVVAKKPRDSLPLVAGTPLRIERSGDRLTLMPSSLAPRLLIEDGLPLIYPADSSHTPILTSEMVTELIEQGRRERERRILSCDEDSAGDSTAALVEGVE